MRALRSFPAGADRGAWSTIASLVTLLVSACTALKPGEVQPSFDAQDGVANSLGSDGAVDAAADDASEATVPDVGAPDALGDAVVDALSDAHLSDSGDAALDSSGDAQPPPADFAPGHLKLWLTADRGLTCASGRVTTWADQSGRHDDATLQLSQLGPQCPHSPSHRINGIDVPYFSAPANGNVVDETLDVDLTFLAKTSFTLFAVERRWADPPNNSTYSEEILGTSVADTYEATINCASLPQYSALAFGYVYYRGTPQLSLDEACDGANADVPVAPATPPAPLSQVTAMLDVSLGQVLWSDGLPLVANVSPTPLLAAADGAIGRAMAKTTASGQDYRFRGDIAEILVYDAALDGAERHAVEAYLKGHWQY